MSLRRGFFLSEHRRAQEVGWASQGWLAAFPWLGSAPSLLCKVLGPRRAAHGNAGRRLAQHARASTLPHLGRFR